MRILLVEDRETIRENYYNAIKDYDEHIEVIEAKSFEELQGILLSFHFDAAIVDYDLSKWKRNTDFASNLDGVKVCDFLTRNMNFKNNDFNLVLYSADFDITLIKDKSYKIIRGKSPKENATQIFHDEVVKDMTNLWEIMAPISFKEFQDFCVSQKVNYYKNILTKKNIAQSFLDLGSELSWASEFMNEEGKIFVGESLTKEVPKQTEFAVCDYERIEHFCIETNKIPNVLWNFTKAVHFEIQTRNIRNKDFAENDLKIFYNICFSESISKYFLTPKVSTVESEKLLKILKIQDEVSLRETQCSIIREMQKNGDSATKIKDKIGYISNRINYSITELFEAEILSRDTSGNTASVELTSLIDREVRYVKEFDLSKLEHFGVDQNWDDFYYCISESDQSGGVATYIEPISK